MVLFQRFPFPLTRSLIRLLFHRRTVSFVGIMNYLRINQKSLPALMLIAIAFVFAIDETSLGQSPQRPADEGETGTTRSGVIRGRVVADGQPVPNARVSLTSLNGQWRSVPTENDGTFQLKGLEPGVFSISAWAPGYASVPIDVDAGEHLFRIGDSVTINLIRGGVITGKVLNSADEPVVAVRVLATMIRDANDKQPRIGASVAQSSDDRGVYRLYGLLPGTYVVSAGGGQGSEYNHAYDYDVPKYAPSSTRDTASEITVGSGEEIKDVDIRYRGELGHSVSGRVTSMPNPKSPFGVALWRVRDGILEVDKSTSQETSGGGFELHGVPDGDYDLWAHSSSSTGESAQSEPRRISVKGADITGIEMVTRPLPSISGQLILIDSQVPECKGKRRPLFDETLITAQFNRRQPARGQTQLPYFFTRPAAPDKAGEFALRNLLPGQYSLTPSIFAKYWYLQSITLPSMRSGAPQSSAAPNQSVDGARNWIALKLGEQLKGLKITLAEGAASVEGKLKLPGDEQVPPEMYVNFIPAEPEKTDDVLRYFTASVNSDGGFTLSQIPPGRYFVFARVQNKDDLETKANLRFPG